MDLRSLNIFIEAAELGSFTQAGEKLGYSQPTVSFQIKLLEKELGVALFRTNCRGAVLTDAGRLLLQDAQGILQQVDAAAAHMRQYAQRTGAEIRLAYTAAVARNIPRQHDVGTEFPQGPGKGKDGCRRHSRPGHRQHDPPKNLGFRHAKSSGRMDQIWVHLLKGRSGITVHQGKGNDCGRNDAAKPCLYHLNSKLSVKHAAKRAPQTEQQQKEKSGCCRRQYHRKG